MTQVPEQAVTRRGEDPADELLRSFGRQIKILRERAGHTRPALGQLLGYSEAQVASIKQGRGVPRPDTIDRLGELLGADGMLLVMKRPVVLARYPAFFRDAARIEETAAEFHQYAPLIVPGMLQTEEYARAMFTVRRPRRSEPEIEQMVSARLARHRLFEREPAPVLSYVRDEAVLQRPIGGSDFLRGQLGHLLLVGLGPNVEIQVMPTRTVDHACVDGPFTLMVPEGGEQAA
ncbi:helix-turn-helix domain-containing protein [Streptomyces olivaceus]|uniref:helix-turn-helix domain-containing protein n=1 Tax=Streptomyces olivaceus TaxID=47716 RepID=UPI0033A95E7D